MPALLLKNQIKMITTLDQKRMVERLYEDQTIQDNMKAPVKAANIDKRSKKFKVLISKGNVKDALKLLIHNMPNRALPISNEAQDLLKQKPPEPLKCLP